MVLTALVIALVLLRRRRTRFKLEVEFQSLIGWAGGIHPPAYLMRLYPSRPL